MIKVSVLGADSPDGGELIRILAMHPDVEIIDLQARGLEGKPVCAHHHGLIGEPLPAFTGSADYSACDVLFICPGALGAAEYMQLRANRPELRVISLEDIPALDRAQAGVVFGLPEINRKLLVRGATAAEVPASFASMALVALYPIALNMLLPQQLKVNISAPGAILEKYDDIDDVCREILAQLSEAQKSFDGTMEITLEESNSRRSALMEIEMECAVGLEQVLSLYQMYDDHNFSFVSTRPVGVSEVAGTNKCIVSVMRSEPGKLTLCVAADCRLRGGAGEAVHIMNLMFGLHEKTGLALKAIDFDRIS